VMAEMFGTGSICMMFIWRNIQFLLPDENFENIVLMSSIAALPSCWVLNFAEMNFISLLGFVASVFITVVMNYVFLYDPSVAWTHEYTPSGTMSGWSIATGIFIVALAGHPILPSIYASMEHPESFEKMLTTSMFIMFVIYGSIAFSGYFVFGNDTQVLITYNLLNSQFKGLTTVILTVFVIANAYFSIAPIVAVFCEIPEFMLKWEGHPGTQRSMRSIFFAAICCFAYLCKDYLAMVEAINGGVNTMITSLICPCLFYVIIRWKVLTKWDKIGLCLLTGCVGLIAVYLVAGDLGAVLSGDVRD